MSVVTTSERLDFDVFGHGIAVDTEDAALRARIVTTLAPFCTPGEIEPDAHFHITRADGDNRVARGRQINTGRLLVIADRRKLIAASLGAQPWQLYIDAFGGSDTDAYYYLFEPLLHMVLKRRGTIPWHGAAVARSDRGALIVGEETCLRPLPAAEGTRRLLLHPPKEYPAVIADPASIEAQFDACATLATAARCFDLVLGRNLGRLPELVDSVLK